MKTIQYGPLENAMQHSIDMAVHNAVSRFERDLPSDAIGLVHRIARAAAETAMEQFCSYANAELRFLQIDYERRAAERMLEVPIFVVPGDSGNGGPQK